MGMRTCKVCGVEFSLEPGHKGLATMCKPTCTPEEEQMGRRYDPNRPDPAKPGTQPNKPDDEDEDEDDAVEKPKKDEREPAYA